MMGNNDAGVTLSPVQEKLESLGQEMMIGMDIPRVWVTGAQTFSNPAFTMMVFREQNMLTDEHGGNPRASIKNVASIVMPTDVAREFHRILGEGLAALAPTDAT